MGSRLVAPHPSRGPPESGRGARAGLTVSRPRGVGAPPRLSGRAQRAPRSIPPTPDGGLDAHGLLDVFDRAAAEADHEAGSSRASFRSSSTPSPSPRPSVMCGRSSCSFRRAPRTSSLHRTERAYKEIKKAEICRRSPTCTITHRCPLRGGSGWAASTPGRSSALHL
jgi:hypothetical protein